MGKNMKNIGNKNNRIIEDAFVFGSDQKVGTIVRTPKIIDINGKPIDNVKILLYKSFFTSFCNDGVPVIYENQQVHEYNDGVSIFHIGEDIDHEILA